MSALDCLAQQPALAHSAVSGVVGEPPESSSSSLPQAAIAGIAVAVVLVILVGALGFVAFRMRKYHQERRGKPTHYGARSPQTAGRPPRVLRLQGLEDSHRDKSRRRESQA
eukprot:m.542751 g.542751  ORF g.542751 m.542751 type:complete len:111 (-) comp57659_c0_seq3:123-455(-)